MSSRKDTDLGGVPNRFPSTRWSMILESRDRDSPARQEALDHLCRLYWKPVYAYIRASRSMDNEEVKDLTQEFFLQILEGDLLARFSPECGSFRDYLQGAIRLFLLDRHEKAAALKRGGGSRIFSLDADDVSSIPLRSDARPEEAFDRQWARSLLDLALDDLRRELAGSDKEIHLRVFERHEFGPAPRGAGTYAALAQEFGIRESDVSVYLAYCRRRLRRLLADRIRDYVATERESTEELARVFALLTSPA